MPDSEKGMVINMKIVFMGTPDFAAGALKALVEAGHDIMAVVTQPDKPKGRGKEMQCTPVKEYALSLGLPVFQPVKIRESQAVSHLKEYDADIYIVVAFGQILTKEILEIPPLGCLNIHASLLPKYRGASPINWAILNGEKETGVTIIQMDAGIDTGDMLLKEAIPISSEETADSLHDKLMEVGGNLIVKALSLLACGQIKPEVQDHAKATHVGKIEKSFGCINWEEPAVVIERKVRGLNSWPSAYTHRLGKQMKIFKAKAVEKEDLPMEQGEILRNSQPGCILAVTKEEFFVQTGEGYLQIESIQLEGKKRLTVKEFLMGYQVKAGEYFS